MQYVIATSCWTNNNKYNIYHVIMAPLTLCSIILEMVDSGMPFYFSFFIWHTYILHLYNHSNNHTYNHNLHMFHIIFHLINISYVILWYLKLIILLRFNLCYWSIFNDLLVCVCFCVANKRPYSFRIYRKSAHCVYVLFHRIVTYQYFIYAFYSNRHFKPILATCLVSFAWFLAVDWSFKLIVAHSGEKPENLTQKQQTQPIMYLPVSCRHESNSKYCVRVVLHLEYFPSYRSS